MVQELGGTENWWDRKWVVEKMRSEAEVVLRVARGMRSDERTAFEYRPTESGSIEYGSTDVGRPHCHSLWADSEVRLQRTQTPRNTTSTASIEKPCRLERGTPIPEAKRSAPPPTSIG